MIDIILFYAMWLAHRLLFRGQGLVAWIGSFTVVQDIVTLLYSSPTLAISMRDGRTDLASELVAA